jgi:hypothetical protein
VGLLSESVEDGVAEAVWVKVKKDTGGILVVMLGVPLLVEVSPISTKMLFAMCSAMTKMSLVTCCSVKTEPSGRLLLLVSIDDGGLDSADDTEFKGIATPACWNTAVVAMLRCTSLDNWRCVFFSTDLRSLRKCCIHQSVHIYLSSIPSVKYH